MESKKGGKMGDHYFSILTDDGYVGDYATIQEAQHARRVMYGCRALAHPIVRMSARWNRRRAR